MLNDALRESLSDDAEDLAAFDATATERNLDFESFLKDLRRRGKL